MLNAAVDRNDPRHGSEGGLPAEEAAALLKVASDAERDWSDPEVLAATAEQQGFGEGAPTLGTDPCFEALIDHPGWISHIRDFIGGADAAAFLSMGCIIRAPLRPRRPAGRLRHLTACAHVYSLALRAVPPGWPGQASRIHSGGHKRSTQTQFVYHAGGFRCGMCNVMLALSDCPVGGGGTMLVPGSVRPPKPPAPWPAVDR